MRRTQIRGSCPYCHREARWVTDHFGDDIPFDGDYVCCGACGEFSVLALSSRSKNMMRCPTPKERLEIVASASAIRCRYNWERRQEQKHAVLQ